MSDLAEILKDKANLKGLEERVLADQAARREVVDLTLHDPDIMVYYHGYYVLGEATRRKPELFTEYWPSFVQLLDHANSYHRDIGLTLIAHLSTPDREDRFQSIRDAYLAVLHDPKFMTGCGCVVNLTKIARACPGQREVITGALVHHAENSNYTDKQEAVLQADVLEYLQAVYSEDEIRSRFRAFIREQKHSISPKTRKLAKRLVRDLGLDVGVN